MSSPLLRVQNLQVKYGAVEALKGLDFEVFSGEIVTLIGSNGAGKTTTLRALSGLVPASGQIEFRGESLQGIPVHKRVTLGISQSPEGRGLFPNLTVLENLQMGAYFRSDGTEIKADIEYCYSLFPKLRERRSQLAGTLSGGEQQMVAISRALMARPSLLLLDEPSLGLAPIVIAQIFAIVQTLNQKGTTVLLVEQNARMALKISHRAYVIETGRIKLSGRGQDLLNDDGVRKAYLGIE